MRSKAMIRYVPCVFALALALSGCALVSPEEPQQPPLSERRSASEANVDPEAGDLFSRAHILWKGGDVCSDPAMAVHLLDQAIAIQPDYADAHMYRGLAYSEMGRDEETFSDLTRAIRLDPRPHRYAYRALGLIRMGDLEGARRDLDKSLDLDADQYRAWNFRAVVNMMEDKDEAACDDFKRGCKNGDCTGYNAAKKEGICR